VRSHGSKSIVDIDELCLFDRALTEAELDMLVGERAGPKEGELVTPLPARRGGVPAATDLEGLKVYLPCDSAIHNQVLETVSKKLVGKSKGVDLVDGRGGEGDQGDGERTSEHAARGANSRGPRGRSGDRRGQAVHRRAVGADRLRHDQHGQLPPRRLLGQGG